MSSDRPLETPKTLPRKKQLCKFCRLIVVPADKQVHEERVYHKSCLVELLDDSSKQTIKVQNELTDQDLKNENLATPDPTSTFISDDALHRLILQELSFNESPSGSSDKFFEFVDDKLSLRSLEDEPIENEGEKTSIKKSLILDNQMNEESHLKSVSSNLSSLNPFDDENDEFYEMNDEKIDSGLNDSVKASNQVTESTKIEIKVSHFEGEKVYPKELNPFGSDEDDLEEIDQRELKEESKLTKSTSSNPFGEEDDETINNDTISNSSKSFVKVYPDELNPFDENDETIEESTNEVKPLDKVPIQQMPKNHSTSSLERFNQRGQQNEFKSSGSLRPSRHSFNQNYDTLSIRSLTPDGKWKSNKKRQAPRPPAPQQSSVNTSLNTTTSNTSSPVLIKRTNNGDTNDATYQSSQSLSENENSFVSLTNSEINESKENISNQQMKRRFKDKPAPLPPISFIQYVDSIEEIEKECDEIGDKLLENSNSIREIENKLKDHQTTKTLSKKIIKKLIFEYLCLIETKCQLDKRQIELSYMKCENKLEKDQVQLDSELRILYKKDAKSKTFDDLKLEEDLLEKLVDIIERKNEIEENIIRIDKSDEFHKSVQKMKMIIREFVDESIIDSVIVHFKQHYLNESNIRNDLFADVADVKKKSKKHLKLKGFTLKKLPI